MLSLYKTIGMRLTSSKCSFNVKLYLLVSTKTQLKKCLSMFCFPYFETMPFFVEIFPERLGALAPIYLLQAYQYV